MVDEETSGLGRFYPPGLAPWKSFPLGTDAFCNL